MWAQSHKPVDSSTVPPQTESNVLISRCSGITWIFQSPDQKSISWFVKHLIRNSLAVDWNSRWKGAKMEIYFQKRASIERKQKSMHFKLFSKSERKWLYLRWRGQKRLKRNNRIWGNGKIEKDVMRRRVLYFMFLCIVKGGPGRGQEVHLTLFD